MNKTYNIEFYTYEEVIKNAKKLTNKNIFAFQKDNLFSYTLEEQRANLGSVGCKGYIPFFYDIKVSAQKEYDIKTGKPKIVAEVKKKYSGVDLIGFWDYIYYKADNWWDIEDLQCRSFLNKIIKENEARESILLKKIKDVEDAECRQVCQDFDIAYDNCFTKLQDLIPSYLINKCSSSGLGGGYTVVQLLQELKLELEDKDSTAINILTLAYTVLHSKIHQSSIK